MPPPTISIVTPSYNQADYLEHTIQSVLGQNIPDLEYIIVDGGSTDSSIEIIQRYAEQLAWWVSESDEGQAHAINKGLAQATGKYVAWLNSDDMYAPGALTRALQTLEANPNAGMTHGNAVSIDADGRPLNDMTFADRGLEGLVAFHIICQPAVVMRREILLKAGFLDKNYHFLLDHHLWLRMAQLAPVIHVPEVWAFARFHSAAKNVAQAAGFGREAMRILNWMEADPEFAAQVAKNRAEVYAMTHRFDARYLLDGGQAWAALKAYLTSFRYHPRTALAEWHRMLFAGLSLVGLGRLGNVYYRSKAQALPESMRAAKIENVHKLYA